MPIYEFRCPKCKKIIEEMFPMNKNPDSTTCKCGSKAIKILSAGIFNIKGFSYRNGYSKENK